MKTSTSYIKKRNLLYLLLLSFVTLSSCDKEDKMIELALTDFQLVSPADVSTDVSLPVKFTWTSSGKGATYHLTVARDPQLSDVVYERESLADTTHQPDNDLPQASTLYWSITAKSPNGEKNIVSAVFSFQTAFVRFASSPEVSTYFVSPQGKDRPDHGSKASPFKTIAYAARLVPEDENDTIFVEPGEYHEIEPIVLPLRVSVVGSGIEKTAIHSEGVTLPDGIDPNAFGYKEQYHGSLFQLISPRMVDGKQVAPAEGNQVLKHFTIDGGNKSLKAGIWIEYRNNVTVSDITIKDCDYRGLVACRGGETGTKSLFMSGLEISNVDLFNSGKDLEDETLGNICLGGLEGALVHDININDSEGYGIKFIFGGYFKNCDFYNINTNLNENDAKWGEKISIELWNLGPGNKVHDVHSNTWLSFVNYSDVYGEKGAEPNIELFNAMIVDGDGSSDKEGIELAVPHALVRNCYIENKGFGVAIWDMGREDITIRHNIFYNSKYPTSWSGGPAIYIDNSRSWQFKDIFIYHNVFDSQNHGVKLVGQSISNVHIKNNLFLHTRNLDVLASGKNIFLAHNLKFEEAESSWDYSGSLFDESNLVADPQLNGTGERSQDFYRPTQGSPLVDSGVDLGFEFSGEAPDIGVYEAE